MEAQKSEPGRLRLNPFAFPADTSFRFLLLIALIFSGSIFVLRWIYNRFDKEFASGVSRCIEVSGLSETQSTGEILSAQSVYQICMGEINRGSVIFVAGGLFLLALVGFIIYWRYPARKIKQGRYEKLSRGDADEVIAEVETLTRMTGIERPPVVVWSPLNTHIQAIAFGRIGTYYLGLSGGLVSQYYLDKGAFQAIVLHELAHIKNRDVDITYITLASWQAFVWAILVPLAMSQILQSPRNLILNFGLNFGLGIRVLMITLLVYLTRNAVLRVREYYADVRAAIWTGSANLKKVLGRESEQGGVSLSRFFRVHPRPDQRTAVLDDSRPLFNTGLYDIFGAGIAAGLAYPAFEIFFSIILSASLNTLLAPVLAASAVTPLLALVLYLAIWRGAFANRVSDSRQPAVIWPAAVLTIGVFAGQKLSFDVFIENYAREIGLMDWIGARIFELGWLIFFGLLAVFYLRWVLSCADLWLAISSGFKTPKPPLFAGFLAGTIVAIGGFTPLMWLVKYATTTGEALTALFLSVLYLLIVLLQSPWLMLTLFTIWFYPMSAWFWRRRPRGPDSARWAVLASEKQPVEIPSSRLGNLRPIQTSAAGLAGAVLYLGLMTAGLVLTRILVPEAVRQTDEYALTSYTLIALFAVLFQGLVAFTVALWQRKAGIYPALMAAFITGAVSAIGFLIINLIFGGSISLNFFWTVFSQFINGGGLLALFAASLLSGLLLLVNILAPGVRSPVKSE